MTKEEAIVEQEPCEDAISRQAVQDYIAEYLSQYLYNDVREAVEVIDEYIGELPSVNPAEKVSSSENPNRWIAADVLDKIRAEIEERKLNSGGEPNRELAFNVCLKIIDKYKAESEG